MVLDDLKPAVADLDRKASQAHGLSVAAYKEQKLDRTRASLRPVLWEHAGQIALGVLIALAVGPVWWNHRAEPGLLVSGLVLHAYAVLMIVLGSRVITLIQTLRLDAPVLQIQKALASLRRSYVMTGFVVGMPWWLLWIPLASVVFGFDPIVDVSRAWLVINLLIGALGILGTLWFFRHLWTASSDSERRRGIEESVAGKSFKNARGFLDEIARFERE
jgi:serine/threonine-protein kinase